MRTLTTRDEFWIGFGGIFRTYSSALVLSGTLFLIIFVLMVVLRQFDADNKIQQRIEKRNAVSE